MQRPPFAALTLGLFAAASTLAADASAADVAGFALDRFEPAERGSEWFAEDSLDLRGHLRPAVGVTGDWGYGPLVVHEASGAEKLPLVDHQLFVHLGAAMNLWDRVRVAMNVPVAVFERGADASVNGSVYGAPSGAAAGDVRLAADVRLFGAYRAPIEGALGVRVWLPSGSRAGYASDGMTRFGMHLSVAGELEGAFVYAAHVGFDDRPEDATFDAVQLGSTLDFGASAGVRALDGRLVVGPEFWGSSLVQHGEAFTKLATPIEALLGAHMSFGDVRVGAGFGAGLSEGLGAPRLRGLVSVEWAPAVRSDP